MARVYRRDRKWYMDAKHPQTGKRVRKVVPAATKREAERVLNAVLRKWELGESLPGERETIPFSGLVEEYWRTNVEGTGNRRGTPHKAATRVADKFRLDRLSAHFGDRPVSEIAEWEYEAFLDGLVKDGLSPATRNRYIAALSPLLRLAVRREWLPTMPQLPPIRSEPRRVETVLNDHDLAALLSECDKTAALGERIRFLLLTAFRLSEVFPSPRSRGLAWEDVGLDSGVATLRDTKSSQDAVVHLHPSAVKILQARYAEAAKAALLKASGKPTGPVWSGSSLDDPSNLRKAFKVALKASRADTRYRLHDLRAQHAVALLRQGEDIETVRKALRHSSITTTARYLRHVEGHVASAVRRLTFPAAL